MKLFLHVTIGTILSVLTLASTVFADHLEDIGPPVTGFFKFDGSKPSLKQVIPSVRNGEILKIAFALEEQVPIEGTGWAFNKQLFKHAKAQVVLKNERGKVIATEWVSDGQSIDLSKRKAALGSKFSVSIAHLTYDFDLASCQQQLEESKVKLPNSSSFCKLPVRPGFFVKGEIEVATDKDQLEYAGLLKGADKVLSNPSNNGVNPRASDTKAAKDPSQESSSSDHSETTATPATP